MQIKKKPAMKCYVLYDIIHIKCAEQANPQRQNVNWWPRTQGIREMGSDSL